jgi:hypothetical protein
LTAKGRASRGLMRCDASGHWLVTRHKCGRDQTARFERSGE